MVRVTSVNLSTGIDKLSIRVKNVCKVDDLSTIKDSDYSLGMTASGLRLGQDQPHVSIHKLSISPHSQLLRIPNVSENRHIFPSRMFLISVFHIPFPPEHTLKSAALA